MEEVGAGGALLASHELEPCHQLATLGIDDKQRGVRLHGGDEQHPQHQLVAAAGASGASLSQRRERARPSSERR